MAEYDWFENRGTCAECGCLERDGNHFTDEQLCTRCDVANNAGDMSAADLLTAAQKIQDAEDAARWTCSGCGYIFDDEQPLIRGVLPMQCGRCWLSANALTASAAWLQYAVGVIAAAPELEPEGATSWNAADGSDDDDDGSEEGGSEEGEEGEEGESEGEEEDEEDASDGSLPPTP